MSTAQAPVKSSTLVAPVTQVETPTEDTSAGVRPEIAFPKGNAIERRLTLVITIIPFAGFLIAIPLLWNYGIRLTDLLILIAGYCFTGLGVTIGFHRLFTHRSFEAPMWVRVGLAVAGSMAVQGGVIKWVADHRRHHAFTDKQGDPHSPHLEEATGVKGVIRGLWHSHIGWFFDGETTNIPRFAPDLIRSKPMVMVDKLTPLWIVVSFTAPPLAGFLFTHTLFGAVTGFVWGSLVRIFLLHHVTWSINSICHFYGKRPFESGDFSTNNWVMSFLAFGEGWHNNHHAFPTSAVHGIEKGQFDLTGLAIKLMSKLKLARNLRIPTEQQVSAKRAS